MDDKRPKKAKVSSLDKRIAKILDKEDLVPDYPVQVSSPVNCVSTGIYTLDLLLCGGYRQGRMYTFLGGPSAGKSSVTFNAIARAERDGVLIQHFDKEGAGEERYMKRHGIDLQYRLADGSRGYYYHFPESGEQIYRTAVSLMRAMPEQSNPNAPPSLIFVCDGYESMTSEQVTSSKNPIGSYARMHSTWQKRLRNELRRSGAVWVATNQLRTSGIGSFYVNPEDDAGGYALKFYADAKVMIRRKKPGRDNCPDNACPFTIDVVRNRMATPHKKVVIRFVMGAGVDLLFDRLTFLRLAHDIKCVEGKYHIGNKVYSTEKARALMKEKEFIRQCEKLRSSFDTYKRFFSADDAARDW